LLSKTDFLFRAFYEALYEPLGASRSRSFSCNRLKMDQQLLKIIQVLGQNTI